MTLSSCSYSTWEFGRNVFDPLLDDVWRAGGEVVWMVYGP
jgi:hypothetical protein